MKHCVRHIPTANESHTDTSQRAREASVVAAREEAEEKQALVERHVGPTWYTGHQLQRIQDLSSKN